MFAWSYRALPESAATLFRLLGLHPGPEFSISAAAVVANQPAQQVRHVLDVLVGAHLIEQGSADRYQFHDLLRAYATDQANHEETTQSRTDILKRVVSWYLRSVASAQKVINPRAREVPLDGISADVEVLSFSTYAESIRWFESERANLVNAVRAAADSNNLNRMGLALLRTRRLRDACAYFEQGLDAFQRINDLWWLNIVQSNLSHTRIELGLLDGEIERLNDALAFFDGLGEQGTKGNVLWEISVAQRMTGNPAEAFQAISSAVSIARDRENKPWEGFWLLELGKVQQALGSPDEALVSYQRSAVIHRLLADRSREAMAWDAVRGGLPATRALGRCRQFSPPGGGCALGLERQLAAGHSTEQSSNGA